MAQVIAIEQLGALPGGQRNPLRLKSSCGDWLLEDDDARSRLINAVPGIRLGKYRLESAEVFRHSRLVSRRTALLALAQKAFPWILFLIGRSKYPRSRSRSQARR